MKYRIYDNDKTFDRYTLRILTTPKEYTTDPDITKYLLRKYGKFFNVMFGFSENPFHPQGFGQFAGEYGTSRNYKHLGKLITIKDLPDQAQKYVKQIIKDYEEAK
jgi:hypothetical protein